MVGVLGSHVSRRLWAAPSASHLRSVLGNRSAEGAQLQLEWPGCSLKLTGRLVLTYRINLSSCCKFREVFSSLFSQDSRERGFPREDHGCLGKGVP